MIRFFCIFVLGFATVLNVLFLSLPFFGVLGSLIGWHEVLARKEGFLAFAAIWVLGFSGLVIFLFLLDFFLGFRARKEAKKFTPLEETEYKKVLGIVKDEVLKVVKFNPAKTVLLVNYKPESTMVSFGYFGRQYIVFSSGFVDKVLEYINENADVALYISKGIFAHELFHCLHKDYAGGDLVKVNVFAANFVQGIFGGIFWLFKKIFGFLPIPFLGKFFSMFFGKIELVIKLIFDVARGFVKGIYRLLRASVMQINERNRDFEVANSCGKEAVLYMEERGLRYSYFYSLHKPKTAKFLDELAKIPPRTKTEQDEVQEAASSAVSLLSLVFITILLTGIALVLEHSGGKFLEAYAIVKTEIMGLEKYAAYAMEWVKKIKEMIF